MCLDTGKIAIGNLDTTIKKGWKIIIVNKEKSKYTGALYGALQYFDEWYKDESLFRLQFSDPPYSYKYPSGFHICKTRKGARVIKKEISYGKKAIIVKCLYRQVMVVGIQCGEECIVAKQICILNPYKKKNH